MNILMCGSGKGSYQVRAVQLGAALGARVTSHPKDEDFVWADVVVLVKRAGFTYAQRVHAAGKPLVWDALDFWQQPEQNSLNEAQSRALLQQAVGQIKPSLTIGATEAMAHAAGGVYLPHHSWAYLTPTPPRDVVSVVGYEGKRKYLGRWGQAIERECQRRDWTFVINPSDLRDCDILVSFRDAEWDGWMCREWKSGVKLVNAMAAGRPIVTLTCSAFDELLPIGCAIEGMDVIGVAFDRVTSDRLGECRLPRFWAACQSSAIGLTLSQVASRYRLILQGVAKRAA